MLPPKLIMSPIDFSDHSHEALKTAVTLASCFGAEICLVNVVPEIPKLPSASAFFKEREYEEELHRDAEARLGQLVQDVAKSGVTARSVVGTANEVGMELLRIAQHNSVDLIVMATHGMTGWRELAFGSVTEKVVRLASIPVLVLRAQLAGTSSQATENRSAAASN